MSQNAVLCKRQDLSSLPLNLPHSMVLKAVWNTPEPSQNCLPIFAYLGHLRRSCRSFCGLTPEVKVVKKKIKKRSKCLHPRTLEFQAMILRFIQIQLSITFLYPFGPHLAILQCPNQAKGTQGDQLRFGVGSVHDLSKGLAKVWQKKGKGDQKKTLFWLTSKDTKPMQVNYS